MKSIDDKLFAGYEEALDAEIAAAFAEDEAEPHVFSDRFEKRMHELLYPEKRRPAKRVRRTAFAAAAVLLAIAVTACAVPQIRESVAGFLIRVFDDHVEYSDPAEIKETIEKICALSPMPEGFELKLDCRTETGYMATYMDAAGNAIMLQQSAGSGVTENIYAESGRFEERSIGKRRIRVHYGEGFAQAAWTENGYFFSIACTGDFSPETFEEWIDAVKTL